MRDMGERNLINAIIFPGVIETSKFDIELVLYFSALALFYIGLLVSAVIMMKTMYPTCKKDANGCTESYCHKLKEHDFKYCIGILFLIIVFICTLTMGNNSKVMEYISFAGTVSSLILSVLAIIMTILSEYRNNVANTKIDNHLHLVQQLHEKTGKQMKQVDEIATKLTDKEKAYDKMIEKLDEITASQKNVMNYIKSLEENINRQTFGISNQNGWTNSMNTSIAENLARRKSK